MPQQNYLDELTPGFTPLLAIKEASRCLLCHDAPCSQACPAQTDPGKFIRSIYFRNFKGAAETIRENNALGAVCARVCPTEKLCQRGCTRSGIDKPIDIARLQRFITDFEQQTAKLAQEAHWRSECELLNNELRSLHSINTSLEADLREVT
ncbi:hypothetical protein MJI95_28085, partial [Salmonella enterica subsp. enterica serovar Kentucky]|nr:hypothetical protein [Salmonella enterica subsp. enterica serovar Kentucky]